MDRHSSIIERLFQGLENKADIDGPNGVAATYKGAYDCGGGATTAAAVITAFEPVDPVALHCPHAAGDGGGVCVNPKIEIVSLATQHHGPL